MNNINEATVLNFYLDEMEKDNIIFLHEKEEYKSQIKESIILVRDEKNPNKRIQSAKILWKTLFEASMSYIDPDKRGYDELFNYFDEYVNFEELIFASDAFYRDHTMHCLWVYFLEEYLKKHEEFDFILESMNSGYNSRTKILSQIEELNLQDKLSELYKIISDSVKDYNNGESIRCVSALTHDLGYPIKKISKINKSISKILPYFSINNFSEFNFEYSNIQDNYIQDFLENLSTYLEASPYTELSGDYSFLAEAVYSDKEGNFSGFNVDKIKTFNEEQLNKLTSVFSMKYHLVKDMSMHLRYSSDFETFQHGIMSAFLLMKLLRAFENVNVRYSTYDDLKNASFSGTYGKKSILTAISDHTSNGYKINSIRNDSAFLALVDELEEFSRISRANQNRQFVSEFCKSNIYIEDGYLNVDFIFDNSSIEGLDPEVSFKGKCNRFLILFDIPDLEENLKIKLRCIGKLPYNDKVYMLEIRRNFANITIDDKEQNIPEYLSSRQFYTKDEYMRK